MEKQKEMDKFLDTYHLPNVKPRYRRAKVTKVIGAIIKIISTIKGADAGSSNNN